MKRYEIGLFVFILIILAVMSLAYMSGPDIQYIEIPGGITETTDTVTVVNRVPFPILGPGLRVRMDEEFGAWVVDQPSLYCFPRIEE